MSYEWIIMEQLGESVTIGQKEREELEDLN
jgi:hypothetical protein